MSQKRVKKRVMKAQHPDDEHHRHGRVVIASLGHRGRYDQDERRQQVKLRE
jgi:hypothetical protein